MNFTIQSKVMLFPKANAVEFTNTLSETTASGWTILSSGWDGPSQAWWAIAQKREAQNVD